MMVDSQEIFRLLQPHYNIYIASATNQRPNRLKAKLEWLNEHFPFIHYRQIVFCCEKSLLLADNMLDDHPAHLENYKGTSILFNAFHNPFENRFRRVKNWLEINKLFLGNG